MKKLLVALLVLIVLLGGAFGGVYAYAVSTASKNALVLNLEELAKFEVTKYSETTNTTTGVIESNVPMLGLLEQEDEIDNVIKEKIDVEEDKVTFIDQETETETEMTLKDYNEEQNVAADYDFWKKLVDGGDYEVETVDFDGEKAWQYTFDNEEISQYVKDFTKEGLAKDESLFNSDSLEAQGILFSDLTFEIEGDIIVTMVISKKDYTIKEATMALDGEITINFVLEGETIDLLTESLEALSELEVEDTSTLDETTAQFLQLIEANDGKVPEATGNFVIRNFKQTTTFDVLEFKDGKTSASDPLTALIGTLM